MSETEAFLRRGILAVAVLIGMGTGAELVLIEHVGSPPQVLPFAVIGLGVGAIAGVWVLPRRGSLLMLRGVAVLLVLAGGFGVFEHFEHNLAFESEIRPTTDPSELIVEAIYGGNPALAPGAVAIMGVLAALATLRDPRLAEHAAMDGEAAA